VEERERFPAEVSSVARARRFLTAAAGPVLDERARDQALLLVSELASNAVRHARSEYEVRVRCDAATLHLEVHDDGSGTPRPQTADPDCESGRGLMLVDTLSSAWGVEAEAPGKTVWFELPLSLPR
jgi:anti-sigma regulatory factor (Ser/Thr protein kinase)